MREILKAGVKVGAATLASLLGWVVAGKVLALNVGASGVGTFGLLRQLLQNLAIVASFNGQTSLVQGIASAGSEQEGARYAGSVLKLQVVICSALVLVLLLGAPWIAPVLLPHPSATVLLRWLSLALFATVAQSYVVGLLNGHRLLDQLVRSQLMGPVAVLALLAPMVWLVKRGNASAFVLMLVAPAIAVALGGAWFARRAGVWPTLTTWRIPRADAVRFVKTSGALLAAATVATGAQYLQSWIVARRLGLDTAGQYWTAWTLSMAYVTLVLGSYGTYYMPSLSRLSDASARNELIRSYLRLSLVAFPLLVSVVVLVKPWVIRAMFSDSLLPALKVMRWMLIGDLLKGVSWVLSFPMLAFSHLRWFFWSEVLFAGGLGLLSLAWIASGGGIEGLGVLFLCLYAVYLSAMIFYARVAHGLRWSRSESWQFVRGLGLVIVVSISCWNDEVVRWQSFALLVVAGAAFIAASRIGLRQLIRGWRSKGKPGGDAVSGKDKGGSGEATAAE